VIIQCLQADPQKRPVGLLQVLEEVYPPKAQEAVKKNTPAAKAASPELKPVLKAGELVRPSFDADPAAIFQVETTVARYQPQPTEHKEIEPLLTEMVVIPGGMFSQGSLNGGRDEIPRHDIRLSSFAMDVHPVTNEQFVRFLEAMGGEKDVNNNDMIRLRDSRIKRSGGKLTIESGYAKHPVVGVAWYGAIAYAKWIGKRLPTEAEWEVAAAAGKEEYTYPTGINIERSQANFFSSDTTSVMSYPAQGYGLYDMAGNVYEWCQDWYGFHYYDISVQEPDDPSGPLQGVYRVLRGGCWKSLKEDLRCAHRHRNNPGTMNGTYGFRCVADVG
jgi:formylglycine-generating enzyme required for sulfatase activity